MISWWSDRWQSLWNDELDFDAVERRGGRSLARSLDVAAIEVEPGSVVLRFDGRSPVLSQVSVGSFGEAELDTMMRAVVCDPMLAAAILMGELPAGADAAWLGAGVHLVPRARDLSLDCSCDEWTQRCRHLAALGELVGRIIDVDPFVLLTLRGLTRDRLADSVKRRQADVRGVVYQPHGQPRGDDPGTDAGKRFRRPVSPLPAMRPIPRRPGSAVGLVVAPTDSGIVPEDIERLIADAAGRALGMLCGTSGSGLRLDITEDLARMAADALDDPKTLDDLAHRAGVDAHELEANAVAWRAAARAGLAVARSRWSPDPSVIELGRLALGGTARVNANVVSGGGRQLRVDPNGLWWRFRPDDRLGWVLDSQGFDDPEDAL